MNGDGDVDADDVVTCFSRAYGSEYGDPNCNFNENNKVDFEDLSWLCRNYGKTD